MKEKNKTIPKVSKIRDKKIKDRIKRAIVVREIRIALKMIEKLPNSDRTNRDKILKRLRKWLRIRGSQSSFALTKRNFMTLWKGFFDCIWNASNNISIQEELAKSFSKFVRCLTTRKTIILYTSCALKALAIEWFDIDHRKLNLFSMLAEMIIRQMFVVCKNKSWNIEWVTEFAKVSTQLFLHEKNERFIMYMARIYVEESAKICGRNTYLPDGVIRELFTPFIEYIRRKEKQKLKSYDI
ncbi:ribosomal RNA processing protein 1 homolog [Mycetomoellerius zeteki]|uniref:ribosomal RNA processing protein 1 homolog n=1 Tax=Mycetomoellerius zeteki TaxID=64791 RepID=UPI00084E9B03|nr:PREDICTED: ribosomal RNA processing protein 1 homolog [Trachymyrmex zeteki]